MQFGFWWVLFEVIKAFSTEHLKYFYSLISHDLTLFIFIFTQLSFLFFSRLKQRQPVCLPPLRIMIISLITKGVLKGWKWGRESMKRRQEVMLYWLQEVRKCRVNEKCFVPALCCLAIFWCCSYGHCCCIHVIDVCTRLTSAWNSSFPVMEEALQ